MNCEEYFAHRPAWLIGLALLTLITVSKCTPRVTVQTQISGRLEYADTAGWALGTHNLFIIRDSCGKRYLVLSPREDQCSDSLSGFAEYLAEGTDVQLRLDRIRPRLKWPFLFQSCYVTNFTTIIKQEGAIEDTVTVWEKGKFMIPAYTSPDICVSRTRMVQSKAPN